MTELTPIPADERAAYYDALRAGRAEAERLGYGPLDDRIFAAFHRALREPRTNEPTAGTVTAMDCPHGYAVGKVCGVCGSGVPSDGEQDATMGDDENEELTPTERAQIAEFGAGLRAGMAEGGAP